MTTDRAKSISRVAEENDLDRWELTTLVVEHGIRTYRVARAWIVVPEDREKLQRIIRRYRRAKTSREKLLLASA